MKKDSKAHNTAFCMPGHGTSASEIAIIDPNILCCIGLRSLLEEILPGTVIRCFDSFEAFIDDTPDMYAHCFVASQVYFNHTDYFLYRQPRCIVLASGGERMMQAGVPVLDVSRSEKELAKSILRLRERGHSVTSKEGNHAHSLPDGEHDLSPREVEVLVLVVKGYINKEIADRLNISISTVISHRKNITDKLGMKSVSALTIYAVLRGYISIDAI